MNNSIMTREDIKILASYHLKTSPDRLKIEFTTLHFPNKYQDTDNGASTELGFLFFCTTLFVPCLQNNQNGSLDKNYFFAYLQGTQEFDYDDEITVFILHNMIGMPALFVSPNVLFDYYVCVNNGNISYASGYKITII